MEITVYTTMTCQYCDMVKDYLDKYEVEYEEKNVSVDPEARKELISQGFMGVPVTMIDGKIIQGFNRQKLDKLLNNRN